jgi:5-methylcytosine-specific restriction endonuclease McrA
MLTYKFICLGEIDYNLYIRSAQWKQIREEVKERDLYSCRTCNCIETGSLTESELDVHHRHYGTLGNERLEDLITLCRTCHRAIHSGFALTD